MSFSFKVYRLFERYRNKLRKELAVYKTKRGTKEGRGYPLFKQGVSSKNKCLDFYLRTGKWPSRLSDSKVERRLAQRFENYISKTAKAYDPTFRRIAMATGRKTNGKRKHDVAGFKQQIIDFIKENGRVPTTNSGEKIPGEGNLRHKLDYYTKNCNDMTLLGMVYKEDKCHLSGIPMRFRPLLNEQLEVSKPLIRLVK